MRWAGPDDQKGRGSDFGGGKGAGAGACLLIPRWAGASRAGSGGWYPFPTLHSLKWSGVHQLYVSRMPGLEFHSWGDG